MGAVRVVGGVVVVVEAAGVVVVAAVARAAVVTVAAATVVATVAVARAAATVAVATVAVMRAVAAHRRDRWLRRLAGNHSPCTCSAHCRLCTPSTTLISSIHLFCTLS